MSEELLKITNLQVDYVTDEEVVHAVNGISLTINKGETVGLVGETGAGKTTTALSILRLLPKFTGKILPGSSIVFEGKELLEADEAEMRSIRGEKISMIFQDPMTSLNPVMTVGEQIAEVIKLHQENLSHDEVEVKVEEILEMVGISATRKSDYPHEFSGGMKQRVVIAIAIACNPQLLIADEPTTALDVTIQSQVLGMIVKLKRKQNSSMLLITHDLGVVARICDKVAIMYAGEIVEFGTLEEIFDRDRKHHPYTVGLFGAIPNLKVKTSRLSPIDGMMPDPTELPEGCKFNPRCPFCEARCQKGEVPVWQDGEQQIRCWMFADAEEGEKV